MGGSFRRVAPACGSGTLEALVAQQLQPVRMLLAGQQLGRTLAHPLGMRTALKTTMVQKELQQRQVVGAQLATQKEVAAQTTVEVLGDAAGTHRLPRQLGHAHAHGVITPAQLTPQDRVPLPPPLALRGPRLYPK